MPTPARLATASSETSVPASPNSSTAAASSLSRLRRASARMVGVFVMTKRRYPPVLCYLVGTGAALHFSLEEHTDMSKTWFITGTSKGFGRIWAEAALARGDRVVATARDAATLADLAERHGDLVLPLQLDVTDKAAVDAAVAQAHTHFGRLDVVVNNAGYGLFGTIEEVSERQARDQIETNLFGALWVTKAALPILREQGAGHIIQVSSIGGVNAFPTVGLYHASKWGLEGFTQALAQEVADLGIKVTIVEPTGYSTDWAGPSGVRA